MSSIERWGIWWNFETREGKFNYDENPMGMPLQIRKMRERERLISCVASLR